MGGSKIEAAFGSNTMALLFRKGASPRRKLKRVLWMGWWYNKTVKTMANHFTIKAGMKQYVLDREFHTKGLRNAVSCVLREGLDTSWGVGLKNQMVRRGVPFNAVGGEPFRRGSRGTWQMFHTNDRVCEISKGRHPKTSMKVQEQLITFITKAIEEIVDGRLDWSPNWYNSGNAVPDGEWTEMREILRVLHEVDPYYSHQLNNMYDFYAKDFIVPEDVNIFKMPNKESAYAMTTWAFVKFLENFARQWFTSYWDSSMKWASPHVAFCEEPCPRGSHAKTRFCQAFLFGWMDREVIDKLCTLFDDANKECKVQQKSKKLRMEKERKRAVALCQNTKGTIRYMERNKIPWADEKIEIIEQALALAKKKRAKYQDELDNALNQRGAFLLPCVCKEMWNYYKEKDENAGERLFENKSANTIVAVQILKSVCNTA